MPQTHRSDIVTDPSGNSTSPATEMGAVSERNAGLNRADRSAPVSERKAGLRRMILQERNQRSRAQLVKLEQGLADQVRRLFSDPSLRKAESALKIERSGAADRLGLSLGLMPEPSTRLSLSASLVSPHSTKESRAIISYVSFGTEPGTRAINRWLIDRQINVFVPVGTDPNEIRWGSLSPVSGDSSVSDLDWKHPPVTQALPSSELPVVNLALVPALATNQQGVRLGRGAGWYDRALHQLIERQIHLGAGQMQILALVYEEEVLPDLPSESFDYRVSGFVTPSRYYCRSSSVN